MKNNSDARSRIVRMRLFHQQILGTQHASPVDVVRHLGAMQAQDYAGAKWSVALRLESATDADVESAIARREIVRTWPQRGTLHFVAAGDIRWMLELLAPRTIAGSARRNQRLEIDAAVLKTAFRTLEKTLEGGRIVARPDVMQAFEEAGISTANNRGYHLLWQAALARLICFGPLKGKQHSFVLLDEWLPEANHGLSREEMLSRIAARYFTSRGPATLKDFIWWSGLTAGEARQAVHLAGRSLVQETIDGTDYLLSSNASEPPAGPIEALLLPGFDEYLLGYADRSAVLDPAFAQKIVPGSNGMFLSTIVIDGRVEGVWKKAMKKKEGVITLEPFRALTKKELGALSLPARRFSTYCGLSYAIQPQ
ncbi:MAG: winged helix DNA-binding domain-containing protein [Acidobacteriota bacterium]